jgi:hypothetical protein
MLQMISPIHIMYVDIIYKDLQERAALILKDLCHSPKKGVSIILQHEWHDIPFL